MAHFLRRNEEAAARRNVEGSTPGENKSNDLTVIRGIGNPTQDQLYKAGVKTYAALAGARPEELREVLGDVARSAKIERWIAQARELGRKVTT